MDMVSAVDLKYLSARWHRRDGTRFETGRTFSVARGSTRAPRTQYEPWVRRDDFPYQD
jgi:hypothetical protein